MSRLPGFAYVWTWRNAPATTFVNQRVGQRCELLAVGALHSALLRFEDGWVVVTDRRGIRKYRP